MKILIFSLWFICCAANAQQMATASPTPNQVMASRARLCPTDGTARLSSGWESPLYIQDFDPKRDSQKQEEHEEALPTTSGRAEQGNGKWTEEDIQKLLDCVSESMENARSFKWRRNFYFIIRHSISKGGKSEAKELLCKAGCAVNLHDWKYVDSNWDKDRQFSLDNWKFHKEWKVICGDDTTSRKTEMRITDLLSVGPCVFEVVPLSRVICFPLGSRHTSISANDIHRPYFSGKSTTGRIGFSQSRYKATGLPVQGVGNATDILAINFAPQYEQSWETLYGTLYVDPKHKRILGLDGYITPFRITQTDAGGCISVTPKVSIGYTHERGFTEVQYITVRIDEGDLHIHSAAYNIGKRKPTDWPSGDSHTHLPGTTEDLTPVNQ